MSEPPDVMLRDYDPAAEADRTALWSLKRAFEQSLGAGTGDAAKADAYAAKLTPRYRDRWLAWVDRCVADDPGCVVLAETEPPHGHPAGATTAVGYVFVLPERLAFIWDAAVINELFVDPSARGTGVADDLMAAAVDTARGQDLPLDRVLLDVDPVNARAVAFYDRWGFAPWGEILALEL